MRSPAANDRTAVTVVEICDPADANSGIELIDLDAVQLQSVPFYARRVVLRAGASTAMFHSTNVRMRTRTRVSKGQVAYVVFGPWSRGTVNGLPVRPGLMLAAGPEAEARFIIDAEWETITLLLPPQDIRSHLVARQRDNDFHLPQAVETLAANPEAVCKLFDWGKQLTHAAAEHPELFNEQPDELLAVQIDLVEQLLATVGMASIFEPGR